MVDAWTPGQGPGRGMSGDGGELTLDQAFDADTLHKLRKAVLTQAVSAGMPDDRAAEVMLAVHELAANAVRHGGGGGRARMRVISGELHCQVSDPGPGSIDGGTGGGGGGTAESWPVRPGRGLWLVRKVADRMSMASDPAGSRVTVAFALPPFQDSALDQ